MHRYHHTKRSLDRLSTSATFEYIVVISKEVETLPYIAGPSAAPPRLIPIPLPPFHFAYVPLTIGSGSSNFEPPSPSPVDPTVKCRCSRSSNSVLNPPHVLFLFDETAEIYLAATSWAVSPSNVSSAVR